MPKETYTKDIIRPGVYYASSPTSKKRKEEKVSTDRLVHWVNQFQEMKRAGLRLPCPPIHIKTDEKGKPKVLGPIHTEAEPYPASDNLGYWEDLFLAPKEDPETKEMVSTLFGRLGTDNEKIGKEIQEVSIYALPKWQDGTGKVWDDALYHIAAVTNPVVPGQSNFNREQGEVTEKTLKPIVEEYGEAVAASYCGSFFSLADTASAFAGQASNAPQPPGTAQPQQAQQEAEPDPFTEMMTHLNEAYGILLPNDTNPQNLVERLNTAAMAMLGQKQKEGDILKAPEGSTNPQQAPVAMSLNDAKPITSNPTVDATIHFSTTPNGNGKPHSNGKAMSEEKKTEPNRYQEFAAKQYQKSLTDRIERLVKGGKVSREYAKQSLTPQVGASAFSLDEKGEQVVTPLEMTLSALEQVPDRQPEQKNPFGTGSVSGQGQVDGSFFSNWSTEAPEGSTNPEPQDKIEEMTEEKAQKLAETVVPN